MIDTIKLRALPREFILTDKAEVTSLPSRYNSLTGELLADFHLYNLEDGMEVTGEKSYKNTDKYNLTIDNKGMSVQLSVPKYARGSNYKLSDLNETSDVIQDLEQTLNNDGILVNVLDMIPMRIDACKNVSLEHPTSQYFNFMSYLGCNRLTSSEIFSKGVKLTGYRKQNGQHQFACYDKREEMKARKIALTGIPKNVYRSEHRSMNKGKVHSLYGFKEDSLKPGTVEDMLNGFDKIKDGYYNFLTKDVFRYDADDKRLFSAKTIREHLLYCFDDRNFKRGKIKEFAMFMTFSKEGLIIDDTTMMDELDSVMDELGYKEGNKRVQRLRLKRHLQDYRSLPIEKPDTVNVRELYRELKTKLLKKVA